MEPIPSIQAIMLAPNGAWLWVRVQDDQLLGDEALTLQRQVEARGGLACLPDKPTVMRCVDPDLPPKSDLLVN